MKKTIILPVLFVLAFILKIALGVEIPEEILNGLADTLAEIILIGGTIWGIIESVRSKKKKEKGEK